ncbi:TonB-dependent receptor [Undibacterium sp. LX40W]|uniref:TonB-dependent receptor n=1 Tax=Undibacterium nitidum TaxID=2762298 RepID=A0A923KMU2_9BURK|nr:MULTISPECIES: TonB-dependent receptor [Undibacterium]MBC3883260.1 TonB-dependent receptor [Undibacterium nitidum]MBC3893593.1 TonB-dependent receptor [Undibacterium sp. LX40W]
MKTNKKTSLQQLTLSAITVAVLGVISQSQALAQEPLRVEVTGSSIKRLASEASLPITSVTGEELEKRGMTTLADLMMALPQSNSLAPSNAGSGTNVNLRGLGVNRTLVLLNGRRLANEAIADGYANLDVIPMSAIARVEVLNDGASSIYGSDAIGGVVNFITKREYNGASVTAQAVQPQRDGGADEQRVSFIIGTGDLQKDGWNIYATADAHRRSRLLGSDRAELSSAELLTSIGRAPSLASGGFAMPANFTIPSNKAFAAANPYYSTGCVAPYSIQGGKNTCVINNQTYNTALYANDQLTFFTKATKRISDDHTISLEYNRGEEHIFGTKIPTTSLAANGVTALLPSTSKWYPGGSGGVPKVTGVTGAPLLVTWSVADLGAYTTKDEQINQRWNLSDEGVIAGWDYKAGLVVGISDRIGYLDSGAVDGAKLIAGITNGTLNPFGLQDATGKAYLDSIGLNGQKLRVSKSTYTGLELTLNKAVMKLPAGDVGLAVGLDFHRDTTEDTKTELGNLATYAGSVPSHGQGARNVAALYAEVEVPVTKELNLNLAVRDDHFSDFGNTVNPKASFRYQPNSVVMFRGSANTGFRAPTLFDRYGYRLPGATTTTGAAWDDPVQCPGPTPAIAGTGKALPGLVSATVCNVKLPKQTGSNAELIPETSVGGTLGMVVEPMKNLTVSVDYWRITMDKMLANLPEQAYFLDPVKYADLFVRDATGKLLYIKNVTMNLGGQKAAGLDLAANYSYPTEGWGTFKVSLNGTYLTQFDNQLEKGGAWASNIGRFGLASNGTTSSLPIITFRWKHTLALNWMKGDWAAQLTQNYNTGYHDQNLVAAQYFRDIKPYQVFNLTGTYRGFKNFTIVAGLTNLFDVNPPVTNHSGYNGYLSSAASPIGRAFNTRITYTFY